MFKLFEPILQTGTASTRGELNAAAIGTLVPSDRGRLSVFQGDHYFISGGAIDAMLARRFSRPHGVKYVD